MSEKIRYFKRHGISLRSVNVVELHVRVHSHPEEGFEIKNDDMSINAAHTSFNEEEKSILVGLILQIGSEDETDESPIFMKVELFGLFVVDDEDSFDVKHIDDWAKRNAPMILHPFLREHVYGLSVRAGLDPVILPLIQVPTLAQKKNDQE